MDVVKEDLELVEVAGKDDWAEESALDTHKRKQKENDKNKNNKIKERV